MFVCFEWCVLRGFVICVLTGVSGLVGCFFGFVLLVDLLGFVC